MGCRDILLLKKSSEELVGVFMTFNIRTDEIRSLSKILSRKIDSAELTSKENTEVHEFVTKIKKCYISFKEVLENSSKGPQDESRIKHDLLNPLTAMKGYAELLLETNEDSNMTEIIPILDTLIDLICIDR
jgi:hypothetical protein